jgi:hypothetical protein
VQGGGDCWALESKGGLILWAALASVLVYAAWDGVVVGFEEWEYVVNTSILLLVVFSKTGLCDCGFPRCFLKFWNRFIDSVYPFRQYLNLRVHKKPGWVYCILHLICIMGH